MDATTAAPPLPAASPRPAETPPAAPAPSTARRAYTKPQLRVYGTLHVLTATNATMNMLDMGGAAATRT